MISLRDIGTPTVGLGHDVPRDDAYWRAYWESKHPIGRVTHIARPHPTTGKRMDCDVRAFVAWHDVFLDDVVDDLDLRRTSEDVRVNGVYVWVRRHVQYYGDDANNKAPEFWQFPRETMLSKVGDCEDGALLTLALCLAAGVPRWWMRVSCGPVDDGQGGVGGHAYFNYARSSDRQWVPFDWCYRGDDPLEPISKRALLKDRPCYHPAWFSFNDESAYAHQSFAVGRLANAGLAA